MLVKMKGKTTEIMTTLRRILTTAAFGIASVCLASAATLTETFTHVTPTSTTPFTDSFTLAGFNTALGTLDSIQISISTTATAEVDVFNITGGPLPFTNATASVPVTVKGPDATTTSVTLVAGPIAGIANPGANMFPGIPGSGSSSIFVPVADFATYENPGGTPVSFMVSSVGGTYSGSGAAGQLFFGGLAVAGGTTTVVYTYDTVVTTTTPEPTTMALFGSAFVGLGLIRRRIKQQ
jgi:hypothetical protein